MKRKQMCDERLSALLTEAYDAHLDAALSCHCEPVTDVTGVASRSFNTNSKDCHDQCVHWSRNDNKDSGEPEAPVAIRSTSTKRARWQGAVAAVLVMTILGAGGWLLHRQLTRRSAAPMEGTQLPEETTPAEPLNPQHCHAADLGGETVWVLDDENARYEGEYDLQSLTEKNPEINWSRDEEREGFEQQTLMSYAEYAAYCEKWGMDQKYRDPDQRYLVWAKWYPNNFGEDLRLIDVTWDAQTAYLYFWNQDEPQVKLTTYWANPGRAWVLVLPTTLEITSLETRRVMSEKTYHWKHLDLTLWKKKSAGQRERNPLDMSRQRLLSSASEMKRSAFGPRIRRCGIRRANRLRISSIFQKNPRAAACRTDTCSSGPRAASASRTEA